MIDQFKIKNLKLKILRRQAGFTLIELLVVIVIIGILTSIGLFSFVSALRNARDSQRKTDLRQMQAALELYRADYGSYPVRGSGTTPSNYALNTIPCPTSSSFASADGTVVYLQKVPCDPLKNDNYWWGGSNYEYWSPSVSTNPNTYLMIACLENPNDPEGTPASAGAKCASGKWFSLTQP